MTFSNLPPGGKFHSSQLPPEGIISLHTVGNTDFFKLGAGGEGVT